VGTELAVVMGHKLVARQIASLPSLLNEFFAPHRHHIQVRVEHGYTGQIVEAEDGGWDWEGSELDDWELQEGQLEEEDLWAWGWDLESGQSFEEWFQTEELSGYVSLIGCYGMSLSVGAKALMLSTGIRWHHFVFDSITQDDLRQFLSYFTRFFGEKTVLYLSDGIAHGNDAICRMEQGLSIEEILSWLATQEAPAQTLREMITTVYREDTKCWSPGGYYVEEL
jgi:hypothetical protein